MQAARSSLLGYNFTSITSSFYNHSLAKQLTITAIGTQYSYSAYIYCTQAVLTICSNP